MYDPLIEVIHSSNEQTFIRSSSIMAVRNWNDTKKITLKDGSYLASVKNIGRVIEIVNSVEDRNEQSQLLK